MRKIALAFAILFGLAILFTGCRDPEEEPRSRGEEAMPSLPLLTEEKPLPPSEEILIPNTEKTPLSTAAPPSSSAAPLATTSAPSTTTVPSAAPTVTTTTSSSGSGLELPDHNWN